MTAYYNLLKGLGGPPYELRHVINPSGGGEYSLLYSGGSVPTPPVSTILFDLITWTGDGTGTRTITTACDLSTGGFIHAFNTAGTTRLQLWSTNGSTVYRCLGSFGDALTVRVEAPYAMGNGSFTVSTTQNVNAVVYVAYVWRRYVGFCDVLNYVGTSSTQAISHALGVAPHTIIVKSHDTVNTSASSKMYFDGETTLGEFFTMEATGDEQAQAGYWGANAPDATTFEVGGTSNNSAAEDGYLAVLFANDGVEMDMGTYTGNGSATGPTVTCGFEPGVVLIKLASAVGTGNYVWVDQGRSPGFTGNEAVFASNNAAVSSLAVLQLNGATGFQITTTDSSVNSAGRTYLYLAIKMPA